MKKLILTACLIWAFTTKGYLLNLAGVSFIAFGPCAGTGEISKGFSWTGDYCVSATLPNSEVHDLFKGSEGEGLAYLEGLWKALKIFNSQ